MSYHTSGLVLPHISATLVHLKATSDALLGPRSGNKWRVGKRKHQRFRRHPQPTPSCQIPATHQSVWEKFSLLLHSPLCMLWVVTTSGVSHICSRSDGSPFQYSRCLLPSIWDTKFCVREIPIYRNWAHCARQSRLMAADSHRHLLIRFEAKLKNSAIEESIHTPTTAEPEPQSAMPERHDQEDWIRPTSYSDSFSTGSLWVSLSQILVFLQSKEGNKIQNESFRNILLPCNVD